MGWEFFGSCQEEPKTEVVFATCMQKAESNEWKPWEPAQHRSKPFTGG